MTPRNLHALLVLDRVRSADPGRGTRYSAAGRACDGHGLASALRLVASRDREDETWTLRPELGSAFLVDPDDLPVTFALDRALRLTGDPTARLGFYARHLQQAQEDGGRLSLGLRLAEAAEAGGADLATAREPPGACCAPGLPARTCRGFAG